MIAAIKLAALRNSLGIMVLAFGCLSVGTQGQPPASPVSRHQGVFHHALNSSCDLIKQATSSLKVPAGDVGVSGVLGVDGTVHDAVIVRRAAPAFDEKALEAVRQWAFVPANAACRYR
jgi:TonB family protein